MTSKSITTRKPRSAALPRKWSPHDYQKKAVKFLLEHGAAALFLDPGLGKTSVTLAAFSFLKKRKVASKALVIAPLRVCHQVWPVEARDWQDFKHLKVVVLHGPHKDQLLEEDADVYCINPEGLEWLLYGRAGRTLDRKRWRRLGFDTLIIDELTKFKHPKGVRFKALKQVLGDFSRRWGLTGTPAANGLIDLFGQCYVLDLGNALGPYITHYRTRYFFNPDGNGWKWVPQAGAKELIYERLKPLALRMSAEDYLELPQLNDIFVELELPAKARKLYDQLEQDLITKMDDNLVVATNAAAATSKLRQIANGGLYVDTDVAAILAGKARRTLDIHSVKTDWLLELIDELQGSPLLIAYEFNHDLERLKEALGADLPYIGGGVSTRRTNELVEAWNTDELPYMAVHPQSAGHGLNLQGGSAAHLAQYSLTWDFDLYDQLIRRIWRQGSKARRVFRYHAVMKDTVDEDMRWALRGKARGQKALFDALSARVKK